MFDTDGKTESGTFPSILTVRARTGITACLTQDSHMRWRETPGPPWLIPALFLPGHMWPGRKEHCGIPPQQMVPLYQDSLLLVTGFDLEI